MNNENYYPKSNKKYKKTKYQNWKKIKTANPPMNLVCRVYRSSKIFYIIYEYIPHLQFNSCYISGPRGCI